MKFLYAFAAIGLILTLAATAIKSDKKKTFSTLPSEERMLIIKHCEMKFFEELDPRKVIKMICGWKNDTSEDCSLNITPEDIRKYKPRLDKWAYEWLSKCVQDISMNK